MRGSRQLGAKGVAGQVWRSKGVSQEGRPGMGCGVVGGDQQAGVDHELYE